MQKVLENRCQSCKKSDNIWGKYTSRAISPIYEKIVSEACFSTSAGYKECSMSFSTISKWFKYFTLICCKEYDETNHKIEGEDEIVEINESLFGKPKYSKGDFSKRRRKWVFGGRTRRAFVRIFQGTNYTLQRPINN